MTGYIILPDRMIDVDVDDGVFIGRQHAPDFPPPMVPRRDAPEVVDPQEATAQQVVAQALDFEGIQADRADVRHEDERVVEQLLVVQRHHNVVRIVARPADRRGGELVEPAHEVAVALGIVGGPARTEVFVAHLRVLDPGEDERPVDLGVRVGVARRAVAAAAPVLLGL